MNGPRFRTRLADAATLLLTVATVSMLSAGCGSAPSSAAAKPAGPPPPVPVDVAAAQRRDVPVQVRAIGWVGSYVVIGVRPQVDGLLEAVHFKEGQDVHAGDVLFTIDPRPFEAALRLAQAELVRDQATAENARREFQRVADLHARGDASDREFDAAQADADAKTAQAESDAAAVDRAKLNLGYCTIRASIDARAGRYMVDAGNTVKARDTDLVMLNQISPVYITFGVGEQHLPRIQAELARRALRVEASVPGDDGPPVVGELTFIDNTVDRTTGMVQLKATFANGDRRLWPGQFVNVTLDVAVLTDAVVVPAAAVRSGQNEQLVYIVNPDDTVELRTVQTGLSADSYCVVTSGLKGDEIVVTDGQLRLFAGAHIVARNAWNTPRGAATSAPADDGATAPEASPTSQAVTP